MTNTVANLPRQVQQHEMVLLSMGTEAVRQTVVKRDDDVLTPDEIKKEWPRVQEAMLKELKTWAKLKCFSRKSRREARNIIDVRWVLKYKWEKENVEWVKNIRARLTVRGFKDAQRADIDRYAGTSSRTSQKLLVSESARRGWPIVTADISKAFLQGVTYKELEELTGEVAREVNF